MVSVRFPMPLRMRHASSPPSMQNDEAHSFTFEAYCAPPLHPYIDPSIRKERDAFHKDVASIEMTTMATPLGVGFPLAQAIDIALYTIDCKGTWAAALLRPVVDLTIVAWGK